MSEQDGEWRDATALGNMYEQQISVVSGRMRHRPLKLLSWGHREFGEERGVGDWKSGPAPDIGRPDPECT